MPDPVVPQGPPQTQGWLGNAPTGDLTLDQLFPPDSPVGDLTQAPPTTQPATTPAAPAAPAASAPPPENFISTSTGTVYKTRDEAVKGLEHKDQLIEKLRKDHIEKFGVDPITGQKVGHQPATAPSTTPSAQPPSYLE